MRVSVVVCTRNGEAFLSEQLTSILRQTHTPSEIIISDDASTDDTPLIIRDFSQDARRSGIDCKVFANNFPLGVTANFEAACQLSRGDVIFLADQDDVWHSGKIARVLEVLSEEDVVLVSSNAEIIDASGKKQNETLFSRLHVTRAELALLQRGELSKLLVYRTAFTGATLAFKRILLTHAMPFNRTIVHDEWLVQIAWLIGEVRTIMDPIMDYRIHASNTIGLSPPPVAKGDDSQDGRLRLHLSRVVGKLAPLVQHFLDKPDSPIISERLALRQQQLTLATTRFHYPKEGLKRMRAIIRTWRSKLYQVENSSFRAAFFDFFRSATKR